MGGRDPGVRHEEEVNRTRRRQGRLTLTGKKWTDLGYVSLESGVLFKSKPVHGQGSC